MVLNPEQNSLSLLSYRFKMSRAPELEYRVQTLSLPSISVGVAEIPSPFVRIPFTGNMTYDELRMTFLVGEEMKDYFEMFNWMTSISNPDRIGQYDPKTAFSDCSVIVLNSAMRPVINVRFTDAFPTTLSGVTFDTTLPDVQYATADVSMRFTRFYYDVI